MLAASRPPASIPSRTPAMFSGTHRLDGSKARAAAAQLPHHRTRFRCVPSRVRRRRRARRLRLGPAGYDNERISSNHPAMCLLSSAVSGRCDSALAIPAA